MPVKIGIRAAVSPGTAACPQFSCGPYRLPAQCKISATMVGVLKANDQCSFDDLIGVKLSACLSQSYLFHNRSTPKSHLSCLL